jgi:hypothetical protein
VRCRPNGHYSAGRKLFELAEGCAEVSESARIWWNAWAWRAGMSNSILLGWIFRASRRKKRERDLQEAAGWPTAMAKLLQGKIVPRDELVEGTLAQTMQVEYQYYFALKDDFFGGYLRSVPCSDSEGSRWMR